MNLLLDTNLLLIYNRDNEIARKIEKDYKIFDVANNLAVSVVTVGEIKSILYRSGVGARRIKSLEDKLSQLVKIGIDHEEIIQKYIEIDAFSQGKHKDKPSNFTPRNMGKNDIWIAATASALNLKLVTTDKDFNHLKEEFIELEYIDFEKYRANKI